MSLLETYEELLDFYQAKVSTVSRSENDFATQHLIFPVEDNFDSI